MDQNRDRIDGHIHLFDHSGFIHKYIQKSHNAQTLIGFMDIDFDNLDKYDKNDVLKYYGDYINNYYDKSNTILLATAKDCQTMINLYKKYPQYIKGFGEIKCYSYYKKNGVKKKLPYDNLDWIQPLCDFNKDLKLPVYLHWYIYNDHRKNELDKLLTEYSSIPFVLCHSGLSPFRDQFKQFNYVIDLLLKHNNLYIDISYKAVDFFIDNPDYIKILRNRCFLGTDLNIKGCVNGDIQTQISTFNKLYDFDLNYNDTIKKIFKL